MSDTAIMEYISTYPHENRSKTHEDGFRRHAMLTPAVVILREEAGLPFAAIGRELGISWSLAANVYQCYEEGKYTPQTAR